MDTRFSWFAAWLVSIGRFERGHGHINDVGVALAVQLLRTLGGGGEHSTPLCAVRPGLDRAETLGDVENIRQRLSTATVPPMDLVESFVPWCRLRRTPRGKRVLLTSFLSLLNAGKGSGKFPSADSPRKRIWRLIAGTAILWRWLGPFISGIGGIGGRGAGIRELQAAKRHGNATPGVARSYGDGRHLRRADPGRRAITSRRPIASVTLKRGAIYDHRSAVSAGRHWQVFGRERCHFRGICALFNRNKFCTEYIRWASHHVNICLKIF